MRPSSSLESAFRTHLSAAMGYYHHLLFKLQHEFQLKVGSLLDFFCVPEPRSRVYKAVFLGLKILSLFNFLTVFLAKSFIQTYVHEKDFGNFKKSKKGSWSSNIHLQFQSVLNKIVYIEVKF